MVHAGVGPLQPASGISHVIPEAPRSNGRAADGQPGSRQTEAGELGTAKQLRAKLGDSLLASELVGHLCCPITEARPMSQQTQTWILRSSFVLLCIGDFSASMRVVW